jgi:putative nucleotidyltransferase with HDIG domain
MQHSCTEQRPAQAIKTASPASGPQHPPTGVGPTTALAGQPQGPSQDLSAKSAAKATEQAAEQHDRRGFETCQEGIVLVDGLRQRVLDCNAAMGQLCGVEHHQIVGQPLRRLGLPREVMRWLMGLVAPVPLAPGSGSLRRLRLRHHDGHWLEGTGSAHAFVADDKPVLQFSFRADCPAEVVGQASVEERVEERVKAILDGAVASLTALIRARDPYTQGHQERVALLCRALASSMGISKDRIEGLATAALLHDIGKMSIGQGLLCKPTALKPEEYELIKTHVQTSHEVLRPIPFAWPVATIVHQHHERLDGSGYPLGLRGDQILLEAQILAVADTVESMATDRPYRRGKGIEVALQHIESHRATLYSAEVVDACLRLFREQGYCLLPLEEQQV